MHVLSMAWTQLLTICAARWGAALPSLLGAEEGRHRRKLCQASPSRPFLGHYIESPGPSLPFSTRRGLSPWSPREPCRGRAEWERLQALLKLLSKEQHASPPSQPRCVLMRTGLSRGREWLARGARNREEWKWNAARCGGGRDWRLPTGGNVAHWRRGLWGSVPLPAAAANAALCDWQLQKG